MSDFDDSDYLASASSEEEDLELLLGIPRIKNENYLGNFKILLGNLKSLPKLMCIIISDDIIPQYDDETFFGHFRLRREHALRFAEEYESSDQYKTQSGQYGKLSALSQVSLF